jgi:hypothetical protein
MKCIEAVLRGEGRIMEEMNKPGYTVHIYGNVIVKLPVQLLDTKKNI